MTDYLPVVRSATPAPVASLTPVAAYRNTRALQAHARHVDLLARKEVIDLPVRVAVVRGQLTAELELLFDGIDAAGQNHAALFLVSEKVARLKALNDAALEVFL